MPAYTRPENGLAVTFHRDSEADDRRIAVTGTAAVVLAMRMLAVRDDLRAGDRLIVEEA
jgi:hypothetical protein